jgi:DNA-binding NarL/FixJ family response regulator
VLKSDSIDQLAAGIEAAIWHKQFLTEKVSRLLFAVSHNQSCRQRSLLTERQRDILQLIADGRTGKEIARDLRIT